MEARDGDVNRQLHVELGRPFARPSFMDSFNRLPGSDLVVVAELRHNAVTGELIYSLTARLRNCSTDSSSGEIFFECSSCEPRTLAAMVEQYLMDNAAISKEVPFVHTGRWHPGAEWKVGRQRRRI